MRVFYLNNKGGGFAGNVEVPEGTTAKEFFVEKMGVDESPDDYKITIQGVPPVPEQPLHDGDTIAITPLNVGGN
jgi:hypothetical protein